MFRTFLWANFVKTSNTVKIMSIKGPDSDSILPFQCAGEKSQNQTHTHAMLCEAFWFSLFSGKRRRKLRNTKKAAA